MSVPGPGLGTEQGTAFVVQMCGLTAFWGHAFISLRLLTFLKYVPTVAVLLLLKTYV